MWSGEVVLNLPNEALKDMCLTQLYSKRVTNPYGIYTQHIQEIYKYAILSIHMS